MDFKKVFNIKNIRNQDLFDIRSFVIVFSVYSFISIGCSDIVYNKDREIKNLLKKVKVLKAEYVSVRTILMTKSKNSTILKKAESFGFQQSKNPSKIMYLNYED